MDSQIAASSMAGGPKPIMAKTAGPSVRSANITTSMCRPRPIAFRCIHCSKMKLFPATMIVGRMAYVKREQDGSYLYETRLKPDESGSIAYGVRVLPSHPALSGKHEMGLIRWA